ncbi:hypothetical protein A9W95_25625 [Mycobacterium sp. 1423905.2]|nr:hypothetical protein A9W95_25625 [Mycobacterium sp. 1423905.2]
MTATDLIEYADTDSVRNQGELAKAVRIGLIKSLCEIGDSRILPLVAELELQYRGVMEGDDAAPLFNPNAAGEARFAALKIVLQRIWAVARTCSKLQIAAIEALQVEIDSIPFRRRLWNWLRGANVVKAEAIVKHY